MTSNDIAAATDDPRLAGTPVSAVALRLCGSEAGSVNGEAIEFTGDPP